MAPELGQQPERRNRRPCHVRNASADSLKLRGPGSSNRGAWRPMVDRKGGCRHGAIGMTIGADTQLDDLALGSPQEPNAFRERPEETLRRWGLGVAYALRPNRIRSVPPLLALTAARLLSGDRGLPHATGARDDCNGLCGLVADLAPATLLEAYGRGLYPFCHIEPLKWWAPPERMVLFYPEFHIAKRLRRQIRNGGYRVTFDRAFADVIRACAKPRAGKAPLTWITPRIMAAYA